MSDLRTLILFNSKYGSTERYARWLQPQLPRADICALPDLDPVDLARYEAVVFGTYMHMGKLARADFIVTHWPALQEKRLIVFSVGAEPAGNPAQMAALDQAVPPPMRDHIDYVPLQGAFDYNRLTRVDKLLMQFPRLKLTLRRWLKNDRAAAARLAAWHQPQDWTTEAAIAPIVALLARPHGSAIPITAG